MNLAVGAAYDGYRFVRSVTEHLVSAPQLDEVEYIPPRIPSTRDEHTHAIANLQVLPGIECRVIHAPA